MTSQLDWSKSVIADHADATFPDGMDAVRGEWFRRDLALLAATRVRASAFRVDFTPELPATSWRIALLVQLDGACDVESAGRTGVLRTGDWRWVDPRYACAIRSSRLTQVIIEMPRQMFANERSITLLLSQSPRSPAMATAVHAAANALFEAISTQDDAICLALAEAVAQMASASSGIDTISRVPQETVTILRRALECINARFADPLLSANALAREIGVPRRSLDKHFAWRRQTADDAIRLTRLQHAARILATDDSRPTSIAMVAAASGFCDQSGLSRSFRRHYGTTPLAFRQKKLPSSRAK